MQPRSLITRIKLSFKNHLGKFSIVQRQNKRTNSKQYNSMQNDRDHSLHPGGQYEGEEDGNEEGGQGREEGGGAGEEEEGEERLLVTGGMRFPSYRSIKTGKNVDFTYPQDGLEFRRLKKALNPHPDPDVIAFHVRISPEMCQALSAAGELACMPLFYMGQQMILHSAKIKGQVLPVSVDDFDECPTGPHGLIWLRCSV